MDDDVAPVPLTTRSQDSHFDDEVPIYRRVTDPKVDHLWSRKKNQQQLSIRVSAGDRSGPLTQNPRVAVRGSVPGPD